MERGNHSDGVRVMVRCREKNMTEIGGERRRRGGRERQTERKSKRAVESEGKHMCRESAVKA